jgi:hypothetical protein
VITVGAANGAAKLEVEASADAVLNSSTRSTSLIGSSKPLEEDISSDGAAKAAKGNDIASIDWARSQVNGFRNLLFITFLQKEIRQNTTTVYHTVIGALCALDQVLLNLPLPYLIFTRPKMG